MRFSARVRSQILFFFCNLYFNSNKTLRREFRSQPTDLYNYYFQNPALPQEKKNIFIFQNFHHHFLYDFFSCFHCHSRFRESSSEFAPPPPTRTEPTYATLSGPGVCMARRAESNVTGNAAVMSRTSSRCAQPAAGGHSDSGRRTPGIGLRSSDFGYPTSCIRSFAGIRLRASDCSELAAPGM